METQTESCQSKMYGSAAPRKTRTNITASTPSLWSHSLLLPPLMFISLYSRSLAFICPRGSWLAEGKQFCSVPLGKKKEKKLSNVTEMECEGTKCTWSGEKKDSLTLQSVCTQYSAVENTECSTMHLGLCLRSLLL